MTYLNDKATQIPHEKFFSFVLKFGLISGVVIGITSYLFISLAVRFYPGFFTEYFNPIFNTGGSRDIFYYFHSFVLGFGLAILWYRFKNKMKGNFILKGLEFGTLYLFIALLPVMWITFSAINVSLTLIVSWLIYGFVQACIAGFIFAGFSRKVLDNVY
ncbi:MAG: hypothetical protein ACM3PT_11865 [Deltaproteobacteria bacterium]